MAEQRSPEIDSVELTQQIQIIVSNEVTSTNLMKSKGIIGTPLFQNITTKDAKEHEILLQRASIYFSRTLASFVVNFLFLNYHELVMSVLPKRLSREAINTLG